MIFFLVALLILLKYLGFFSHKYNNQLISIMNLVLISEYSENTFLMSFILDEYLLSNGEILL